MKSRLLLCLALTLALSGTMNCQVPQGFNYQAIARASGGAILANATFPVEVTIQTLQTGGTVLYVETKSVTSDQFGLISFVVGTGPKTGGSLVFSAIDWDAQPLFIKTRVQYPGVTWNDMGTSQLWSVPYSLRAKDTETKQTLSVTGSDLSISGGNTISLTSAQNQWQTDGTNVFRPTGNVGVGTSSPTGKLTLQPPAVWDDNTPLFEVKNNVGVPVLAVYNNGVRVLVELSDAKGAKGGFSVSGFNSAKGNQVDLMRITPDSIRLNINNEPLKGAKGGFAIGGFNNSKGSFNQDFMYITPEISSYGQHNTFLGYHAGFNTTASYNSFIGYQAGLTNTLGYLNSFVGYNAGLANISGYANVFMGPSAGLKNTIGYGNVFVGFEAGRENTTGERGVKIGIRAGLLHKTGEGSVSIGYEAGSGYDGSNDSYGVVTGQQNTMIGLQAGKSNLTGSDNTIMGFQSGIHFRGGSRNTYVGSMLQRQNIYSAQPDDNVYLGYGVAYNNQEGDRNVIIGSSAGGHASFEGSGSVFIGYNSGSGESGSNKLYIDNSSSTTPLIYGDFTDGSEKLVFNGNVGIGVSPSYKLQVGVAGDGSQACANAWNLLSDASLKTGFLRPENPINMIRQLNGYYFFWNMGVDKERQFGISAQEVEKVLPEIVSRGEDGYLSVDYGKITPLLIEAIKEQQQQIESSRQENIQLKSELETLRSEVEQIKSLLADIKK